MVPTRRTLGKAGRLARDGCVHAEVGEGAADNAAREGEDLSTASKGGERARAVEVGSASLPRSRRKEERTERRTARTHRASSRSSSLPSGALSALKLRKLWSRRT